LKLLEANTKTLVAEEENSAEVLLKKGKRKAVRAYNKIDNIGCEVAKRAFDIACGTAGVLVLVPVTIGVKIASMVTGDYGPIFYSQNRIGKDGKEFKFYKFRSMCQDADIVLDQLLRESPEMAEEYKVNKKLKNDPRITKVGKFIRRSSIDELPQFINVLKGDMSFIGNRPYLPREKEDMGESFDKIVSTKPGITGYWQVSGRSDTTFEKRLELEKYYSDNYSLNMDLNIFLKTFKAVFGCVGSK
jgi:undecaprenyl-phosphate galactose phosphotransferase